MEVDYRTYLRHYPDRNGRFGPYGGAYLTEELVPAFEEIADAYQTICHSSQFISELRRIRKEFQEDPHRSITASACQEPSATPIYLKEGQLNHTGAHKLNHCMGEGLLAKFIGKKRLIAETGAGQHGVAIATAAAFFGLECEVHMGEVDIAKQAPNVTRMKILGAKVVPVTHGNKTLKEAVDSAFESYAKNYKDSIYCIGSAVGPHPFPLMVRDFQYIVGEEAKDQFKEMTGLLPDVVCASVGGGSNSIGMFVPFVDEPVDIVGVEPLGRGTKMGDHAASMQYGEKGVMHGFESIMLKDDKGEPAPVYSIASGLDYPSVGPEHAFLRDLGRVQYDTVSDEEAMDAFFKLSRTEGIIPAIESAHAVAYAMRKAKEMKQGSILVNLSGRGDKDIDYVVEHYGYGDQFFK
ncbi:MAG: tryptophan synthase subunit beta [Blautia coccoides]